MGQVLCHLHGRHQVWALPRGRATGEKDFEAHDGFFARQKKRLGADTQYFLVRARKAIQETEVRDLRERQVGRDKRAFNRYFYRIAKLVHGVPIACRQYGLRHENNKIERHNEDNKQRQSGETLQELPVSTNVSEAVRGDL